MKGSFAGPLALALGICLAAPLRAVPLTDMQAASIYAFAYGQYGGALPEREPVIHIVSLSRLRELIGCERCPVRALHQQGVIYLDERLDFERAYDASILLHEYVHYLQWLQYGEVADCKSWLDRERQAYMIQAHVLARVGEDSMPVLGMMRMLRC